MMFLKINTLLRINLKKLQIIQLANKIYLMIKISQVFKEIILIQKKLEIKKGFNKLLEKQNILKKKKDFEYNSSMLKHNLKSKNAKEQLPKP